jgi:hypothetical protein
MNEKTRPSKLHIKNATNIFEEYNDDGLTNQQEEPKEDGATTQLLNLVAIIQNVGIENHDEHEELNVRSYVQEPRSPIATHEIRQTLTIYDLIIDLDGTTINQLQEIAIMYKSNPSTFIICKFVVPITFTCKEDKGERTIARFQPITHNNIHIIFKILCRKVLKKETTKKVKHQT